MSRNCSLCHGHVHYFTNFIVDSTIDQLLFYHYSVTTIHRKRQIKASEDKRILSDLKDKPFNYLKTMISRGYQPKPGLVAESFNPGMLKAENVQYFRKKVLQARKDCMYNITRPTMKRIQKKQRLLSKEEVMKRCLIHDEWLHFFNQ
jgi:hypothetical protein